MFRKIQLNIQDKFALNDEGLPTTYVCFEILRRLYYSRNEYTTIGCLRSQFATRKDDVNLICEQLVEADYLELDANNDNAIRYKFRNCRNDERQCRFEKYLLDVETDMICVKDILPYSPSFE